MKRRIFAMLEVDDDTAFRKIDDGPIPYLEKEMGRLEQNQIFLKDAFIADKDEPDLENAYINYVAEWAFSPHWSGKINGPLKFDEWKQKVQEEQNQAKQKEIKSRQKGGDAR